MWRNRTVYVRRYGIMLYSVCNVHAVSSVCNCIPLPTFPDSQRNYFLFLPMYVPLYAFSHPHMVALNTFYITLANVSTFCSKRLLVYWLVHICQHFAMFFSKVKISSHDYFFYSSNKIQQLYKRETKKSLNVICFKKLSSNSFRCVWKQ